jgi:murein DD-endopeptidase MepM/ murein hydrolase activator NlpD
MSGPVQAFPLATLVRVPRSHWDGTLAVDLFAPCGTSWVAMFDGVATPHDFPLGGHTILLHGDDGTDAYYAHGRAAGRANGRVNAGDVIGQLSNTGNANKRRDGLEHDDECHLHLAIGAIDSNGSGTIAPWDVLDAPLSGAPPPAGDAAVAVADAGTSVATAAASPPVWALVAGGLAVAWALDLV